MCADSVAIFLEDQSSESSYIVKAPEFQLESKLIFPKHFNTLGISYNYSYLDYDFAISTHFLLHSSDQKGEDFDWKNGELTVYSSSTDILDSYQHYKFQISKKISPEFSLTAAFVYKDTQEHWSNTKQQNYITDTTSQLTETTLQFSQTFYTYLLGMTYSKKLFSEFSVHFNPSFTYSYIDTKDVHIVRNFYVFQNAQAFGYDLKLLLQKKLTENSTLGLNLQYSNVKDKQTDMSYYYISSGNHFATYPSSYQYNDFKLGLNYMYTF
ncbi:hypothetical protein [Sulfurimonas sp.]